MRAYCLCLTVLPVNAAATVGNWSRNCLTAEEHIPFNINPRYESLHDMADLKSTCGSQKWNDATVQSSAVHNTVEDAGMQVREHMKAREETFTVQLWTQYAPDRTILEQLMEVALEHTGDPEEGDYLAWQFAGGKGHPERGGRWILPLVIGLLAVGAVAVAVIVKRKK